MIRLDYGLETQIDVTCVATVGVEGETWLRKYREKLVEDRMFPVSEVFMREEFDPTHPDFEKHMGSILLVHDGVSRGIIDQVHYTQAAAQFPAISIFMSSALPSVQFVELDGEF